MSLRNLPMQPTRSWPAFLVAAWAALTDVFTALRAGPADELSVAASALFWATHVAIALGLLQATQMGVERARLLVPAWSWVALSAPRGALLFTPVAGALDPALTKGVASEDGPERGWALWTGEFLAQAPLILLIWLGLNERRLLRLPAAAAPEAQDLPAPRGLPRGGRDPPILSLSAELHDTRLRWHGGSALVLFPFSATVAETGGGMQVHRSQWLDPRGVVEMRRIGQRGEAEMVDGAVLPVSRPRRAATKAAAEAAGGRLERRSGRFVQFR